VDSRSRHRPASGTQPGGRRVTSRSTFVLGEL
jgi:hypothetical protein